jgi:hypothetical protein
MLFAPQCQAAAGHDLIEASIQAYASAHYWKVVSSSSSSSSSSLSGQEKLVMGHAFSKMART